MIQLNNQKTTTELCSAKKILLIDDYFSAYEQETRRIFKSFFREKDEILLAKDLEEGLAKIKIETPDLIISEICLRSKKYLCPSTINSRVGFKIIDELKNLQLNIPVIFLSTMACRSNYKELALQKGAFACFQKADRWSIKELRQTARRALGLEMCQETPKDWQNNNERREAVKPYYSPQEKIEQLTQELRKKDKQLFEAQSLLKKQGRLEKIFLYLLFLLFNR